MRKDDDNDVDNPFKRNDDTIGGQGGVSEFSPDADDAPLPAVGFRRGNGTDVVYPGVDEFVPPSDGGPETYASDDNGHGDAGSFDGAGEAPADMFGDGGDGYADVPDGYDGDASSGNADDDEGDGVLADTHDEPEDMAFSPSKKISADDAESGAPKSKPPKLNKKFLLTAVVVGFCLLMMTVFLMPGKSQRKGGGGDKPAPSQRPLANYQLYAENPDMGDPDYYDGHGHYPYMRGEGEDTAADGRPSDVDSDGNVIIPPVVTDGGRQPYDPKSAQTAAATSGTTGGTTVQIPDTRNDALQAKSIRGIKGLSSTQESYSTDYQETILKNTASSRPTNNFAMPSKDEYMSNVLSAYTTAYGNASAGNNSFRQQNDQDGKTRFYEGGDRANAGRTDWLGLNTIWQGSIFEAVLMSDVNTDLPGEVVARVAKNIYSSQDGRYLLIPQNSMLIGTYNSSISYAQRRVQVRWDRLIRPDGLEVNLGGMNGTDAQGAAGLKGWVNDHPGGYLKAIAVMSVFSILNSEVASQIQGTNNQYLQNLLGNTQSVVNQLGDKLIDRAMNVQPTIRIRGGTKINIVVNQNLQLPPVEEVPVTQKYERRY